MPQKLKLLTPHLSACDRFGAELRARRIHRGLSQAALARTVHVHPDLIAKVEKAVRRPTRTLAAACDEALAADGALIGLWLLTTAQPPGPLGADGGAAALAPIGQVITDADMHTDPAASTHDCPHQSRDDLTAVIRLDAQRYGAADLAGLEQTASIEVVWHAARVEAGPELDEHSPDRSGLDKSTTAELSPLGVFATPALRRPYRLAFTRCVLLGVKGIELRVHGLAAPPGTAVYDLWPCPSVSEA